MFLQLFTTAYFPKLSRLDADWFDPDAPRPFLQHFNRELRRLFDRMYSDEPCPSSSG